MFGDTARKIEPYFVDIKNDLRRANMDYTLLEYLSMMLLVSAGTFFVEMVLLTFIFAIIGIGIISSLLLALTLSVAITGILLFLFYSYPATTTKNRDSKIEKTLPFAVSYLASIASGNVQPVTLFETLSQFKDYGEIAEESHKIHRNVEMFGMTFSTAVRQQAQRSPSRKFKELLWGIDTVIATGGDIGFFLSNKAQELMNEYRRKLRKYTQDLSLFVEIYMTLIIIGSIFFIVLSTVMTTISGGLGITNIQALVTFFLLPGISIGFMVIIKAIAPAE
jgi:flagellar protein FlaJ